MRRLSDMLEAIRDGKLEVSENDPLNFDFSQMKSSPARDSGRVLGWDSEQMLTGTCAEDVEIVDRPDYCNDDWEL